MKIIISFLTRRRLILKVKTQKDGDKYFCVFGQYVLTKEVFDELEDNILHERLSHGEIQLTDALEQIREKSGMIAFAPDGKSYDIGLPEMYRQTLLEYGKNS